MNTATNTRTGATRTFDCDIYTFATALADNEYVHVIINAAAGIITAHDVDGNADTYTVQINN